MAMTSLDFLIDHERHFRTKHRPSSNAQDATPEHHEFRALVKDLLVQKDADSMADTLMKDASSSMDDAEAGPEQQVLTGAMGLMNLKAMSLIEKLENAPDNRSEQNLGTEVRMPITAARPTPSVPEVKPIIISPAQQPEFDEVRLPIMATRPNHFSMPVEGPAKPAPISAPDSARSSRTASTPPSESMDIAQDRGPAEIRRPIADNRPVNESTGPTAGNSRGIRSLFSPAEAHAAEYKPSPVESIGQSVRMPIRTTYVSSTDFDDMVADKSEVVRRKLRDIGYADVAARGRDITLGTLTAKFESGTEGVAAIGYDRMGGTSYGKYQISSRAGTMSRFIDYLKTEEPAWAERLENAGPANTRSRRGAMPSEWRAIAAESPDRFEALQERFIMRTSYKPALEAIKASAKVDVSQLSHAVQEVLHSTAVQHGANGAARIFARAAHVAGSPEEAGFEKRLIEAVYDRRKRNFGGSTHQVRVAVKDRLAREETMALALLEEGVKKVA
ncbi:chitosanase [Oceanidesulfovibrio indonesiensis]|nr:chitosanase [Oceanidesulfovibrio indonesiensis]